MTKKKAKGNKGPKNPANKQQVAMTRNKKYVGGTARQQQAAQSSTATGQGRTLGAGPRKGGVIPKMQTVTLAKPKPQESKVRKRPGFSHGGEVMPVLKPN